MRTIKPRFALRMKMALTRKEISENAYRRRRENGLCPKCGKKLDRDGYYCSECLVKAREYERETRKFCREHHICTECKKERVFGEDKICFECRAKKNKYRVEITEEQRKKRNDNFRKRQTELYKKRSAQAICTRCGKRKAVDGKKKCAICLEKDAAAHRRKYFDKPNEKEYRKENHLCYFCGDKIEDETKNACNACSERGKEARAKASTNNKYWKLQNRLIFKNN